MEYFSKVILFFCIGISVIEAGQYCGKDGDQEFYCDTGHCCGEFKCCNYYRYYEMWWFWLIWCVIIMLGCSCAYYRRNRMGSYGYLTSYFFPSPSIPMNNERTATEPSFKLPSYEEAIAMPQISPPTNNEGAPPPYIFYAEHPLGSETQLTSSEQHTLLVDTLADEQLQQLQTQQQQSSNSSSTSP